MHPPEQSLPTAEWADEQVALCIAEMAGNDVNDSTLLKIPVRMGGLGIRSFVDISSFAYFCRGKGEQKERTAILDEALCAGQVGQMSEQQVTIHKSYREPPARMILTSGKVPDVSDGAFRMALRDRCMLPSVAPGTCRCGQRTSADHVYQCSRNGEAQTLRHDAGPMQNGGSSCALNLRA